MTKSRPWQGWGLSIPAAPSPRTLPPRIATNPGLSSSRARMETHVFSIFFHPNAGFLNILAAPFTRQKLPGFMTDPSSLRL